MLVSEAMIRRRHAEIMYMVTCIKLLLLIVKKKGFLFSLRRQIVS